MPSSVTVDDELRKKLKKLAAELDTTQGDIISQAVSLYEKEIGLKLYAPDPKARKVIQRAAKQQKDIQWRKLIRKALLSPGPQIEEMRISNWGELTAN
ncbi:MAG: ribbon-helix-helix protein, CopG family [Candidatus Hodarchaeales archaeon]